MLLVNPGASRAERSATEAREWLAERSELETFLTRGPDDVSARILERGREFDRIVIGGGDGTLSGALPALIEIRKTLAILPLGTANDFARTISVPTDPRAAAEVALSDRTHKIDVGLVNGRHFINVASIGVATRMTKVQSKSLKRVWRGLSYLVSLRRVFREAAPFPVEIEIDGKRAWKGKAYQVSVGNGRHHGGGMTVDMEAALDDGVLHLYIVRPAGIVRVMRGLARLRLGLAPNSRAIVQLSGSRVRIRTPEPMSINTDGEITTKTPAEFSVLRSVLEVVVPATLPEGQKGLARTGEVSA